MSGCDTSWVWLYRVGWGSSGILKVLYLVHIDFDLSSLLVVRDIFFRELNLPTHGSISGSNWEIVLQNWLFYLYLIQLFQDIFRKYFLGNSLFERGCVLCHILPFTTLTIFQTWDHVDVFKSFLNILFSVVIGCYRFYVFINW